MTDAGASGRPDPRRQTPHRNRPDAVPPRAEWAGDRSIRVLARVPAPPSPDPPLRPDAPPRVPTSDLTRAWAHALASGRSALDPPLPIVEAVPTAAALTLALDPARLAEHAALDPDALDRLPDRVADALAGVTPDDAPAPAVVEIRVRYGGDDGPDLEPTARELGMTPAELARRHAAPAYTADFLGFAPGFAYLRGLDPALRVTRLATPRRRVEPGSVAIAEERTAVYPGASPGGWRVIGRTDAALFDPRRDRPNLIAPGDRVHFIAERPRR